VTELRTKETIVRYDTAAPGGLQWFSEQFGNDLGVINAGVVTRYRKANKIGRLSL
jgi:hypothetical protein